MTIDEAIALSKAAERRNREKAEAIYEPFNARYLNLAEDNRQLAEWLEELKAMRNLDKTNFSDVYEKGRTDKQNEIIKALAEYNTRNLGNAGAYGFDVARSIVEQTK